MITVQVLLIRCVVVVVGYCCYTANEERGKRLEIPEFGGNLGGI